MDWKSWKSGDEFRPSRLQHCWNQPEYWEKSWKPKEICCHLESSEISPANAGVKNSQGVNNDIKLYMCLALIQVHREKNF